MTPAPMRAAYLCSSGVEWIDLSAGTIQEAIDEARAAGETMFPSASSVDIYAGEDKVETLGLGEDPYRT